VGAILGSNDAVLQAVIEFGAAVYGNSRSGGGVDDCDEVNSRFFHHPDSSKDALSGTVTVDTRTDGRIYHGEKFFVVYVQFIALSIKPEVAFLESSEFWLPLQRPRNCYIL
jgi:hypothetical protein